MESRFGTSEFDWQMAAEIERYHAEVEANREPEKKIEFTEAELAQSKIATDIHQLPDPDFEEAKRYQDEIERINKAQPKACKQIMDELCGFFPNRVFCYPSSESLRKALAYFYPKFKKISQEFKIPLAETKTIAAEIKFFSEETKQQNNYKKIGEGVSYSEAEAMLSELQKRALLEKPDLLFEYLSIVMKLANGNENIRRGIIKTYYEKLLLLSTATSSTSSTVTPFKK